VVVTDSCMVSVAKVVLQPKGVRVIKGRLGWRFDSMASQVIPGFGMRVKIARRVRVA
jgi:hypothetical protein